MAPTHSLSWAVSTDPGLRRTSNEDSYSTRADVGLFVVADGMGGHVAGEVASRVAVEAIEAFIEETAGADKNRTWPFPVRSRPQPRSQPTQGGVPAREPPHRRPRLPTRRICAAWRRPRPRCWSGRSSASVGARRRQPRLRVARSGKLEQITDDHSWVEEQVRAGTLTPERRAPASVAQRRDARAVGRRRSGSGRHRGDAGPGRALSALFGRPVRRRRRTSASRRSCGQPGVTARGHLPARWSTRPTRQAAPTTSRR